MSTNPNSRLEAFCDGVFAIAITLLILEIKVPEVGEVHGPADLWRAVGHEWPSFFALGLSFLIILIAWVNHHNMLKLINRTSPKFIYANGLLLLTVVILPFPTSMMAEYIQTESAQTAIIIFSLACLFHNIGWNVLAESMAPLFDEKHKQALKEGRMICRIGFIVSASIVLVAIWFPYTALVINTIVWFLYLFAGIFITQKAMKL